MPTVPTYQDSQSRVALNPNYSARITTQADGNDFGAQVGRGVQQAAAGLGDLGDALVHAQDLDNVNAAKDADNNYASWTRNAMYGDGGFMTLEGSAAVDARAKFERDAAGKQTEFGQNLNPGAAKYYKDASTSRLNSVLGETIEHTATQRKQWFSDTSTARMDSFANDALTTYGDPQKVNQALIGGIGELRNQADLHGWDDATFQDKKQQYVSGVTKNVVLRMAQDDPVAAQKYMTDAGNRLTGSDQYDLGNSLKVQLRDANAKSAAAGILGGSRGAGTPYTDPTGAQPAAGGTGSQSATDPTGAKPFLMTRLAPGHPSDSITGLAAPFAANVAAMIEDAPADIQKGLGIYSGYRSPDHQAQIIADSASKYGLDPNAWMADVKSMGSVAAGQKWASQFHDSGMSKWVAKPGGSNHQFGLAADLSYNGTSMEHAPQNVVDWVHQNATKYGLYFPLANENWHVELAGTRGTAGAGAGLPSNSNTSPGGVQVATAGAMDTTGMSGSAPPAYGSPTGLSVGTVAASNNTLAPRTSMPSYDDIETKLAAIADPQTQDAARRIVYARMEAQSKAAAAETTQAKAQLWKVIDQGGTPDQVPTDVQQAAGMEAMSSAWSYMSAARNGRDPVSDPQLVYQLKKQAASDPDTYAGVDLNDYRGRLSKSDFASLTDNQTTAISDKRKALETGASVTQAFGQAEAQLRGVGIIKDAKDMGTADYKRVATFQNTLSDQMDEFQKENNGRRPRQAEIQEMISRNLMPIVFSKPGTFYDSNTNAFNFEAGQRPDGTTVKTAVQMSDIPSDVKGRLSDYLERTNRRKPTDAEVVGAYVRFKEGN